MPEEPLKPEDVAPAPPPVTNQRQGQRWTETEDYKLRSRVGQQKNEVDPVKFVEQSQVVQEVKDCSTWPASKLGKVVWQDNKAKWN